MPTIAEGTSLESRVREGLLDAVRRAPVERAPFAHVRLERVVPEDVYRDLVAHLPPPERYHPDPGRYRTPDGRPSRYVFSLDDPSIGTLPADRRAWWTAVHAALRARELRDALFDALAPDLCRRFRTTREGLRDVPAFQRASLVRDLGGYRIDPHPDTRAKIVTLQIYLPSDESQAGLGTAIYRLRLRGVPRLLAGRTPLEKCGQFAFVPNSGYAFAVSWKSWHGVERLPESASARESLLMFYYREPAPGAR